MASTLVSNKAYHSSVKNLKSRIRAAQIKSSVRLNIELIGLYWELGREITEKEESANWGDKFLQQLAHDLKIDFPEVKGFSLTNLKYIRRWYQFYSKLNIGQQAVDQLNHQPPNLLLAILFAVRNPVVHQDFEQPGYCG